jgi:hypothetical protein
MKFRITTAALVAAATALTGCSWVFLERPPQNRAAGAPVHCTASGAAPGNALDFNFTGGEKALLFGFSAGLTALFAVSAAQGYADTASCQELRSEQSWLPGTAR